ncbi:MAG: class I SAM-dependent methyltransferase [Halioglobus sp.]|nr:class I SAM-dependent methyltransferase [Halioglobus sp.]
MNPGKSACSGNWLAIMMEMPFQDAPAPGLRYHFENEAYTYGDGILTYCMIRHLAPSKVIEVGSGFSSCLILDTNELFFNGAIETTFIEPYPQLLNSLITKEDAGSIKLIPERLQDVDTSVFDALHAGDILFIDSTHVSKIDSDVNYLFFEILPRLEKGVTIHFHDIFYPFEYPRWWVYEVEPGMKLTFFGRFYSQREFPDCPYEHLAAEISRGVVRGSYATVSQKDGREHLDSEELAVLFLP